MTTFVMTEGMITAGIKALKRARIEKVTSDREIVLMVMMYIVMTGDIEDAKLAKKKKAKKPTLRVVK